MFIVFVVRRPVFKEAVHDNPRPGPPSQPRRRRPPGLRGPSYPIGWRGGNAILTVLQGLWALNTRILYPHNLSVAPLDVQVPPI